MTVYHKLIRDHIPEILRQAGKTFVVRTLSEAEFQTALHTKLLEEVEEYRQSQTVEELADIVEVVYALARMQGCPPEELEHLRREKAASCGTFTQRLFLEVVHTE